MVQPIVWAVGLLAVLAGGLAVAAWRQQPQPGARALALMAVGTTWWTGAMVVGHLCKAADRWALHVFLTRVEWIGTFVMAFSWFVFALAYTGRGEYANRRIVGLLAVVPGVVYPIAFGNYLIVNAAGSAVGLSPGLGPSVQPWMTVQPLVVAYVYALVAVSSALLLRYVFTSRLPHPEQAILWLLAVAVPWIVNVLYFGDVIPPLGSAGVDPTPLGFVLFVGIGILAIAKYDAFGVAPLARAYVVDRLDTGVIVYDRDGRLVDANEWAASMLGLTGQARGRLVWNVVASATGKEVHRSDGANATDPDGSVDLGSGSLAASTFTDRIDGRVLRVDTDDGPRVLSIDASVLHRQSGEDVTGVDGYAIVLRDVTERRRRKRALESQNEQLELVSRIVSHDIRNEMNMVLEIAGRLESDAASDDLGCLQASMERYADYLEQRGERVVDLTEQASDLVQAVEETATEPEPVPLQRTLQREVANASSMSADATITVEGEIPDVPVSANEMLSSVFANLLTNAIQHNDGPEPTVAVSATATDDAVIVRFADDGPGIPDDRKPEVFEQASTLDGDGTGLGLYLVETIVDQYDGEVWVEDRPSVDVSAKSSAGGAGGGGQVVAGDLAGTFADGTSGSVFVVKLRRA
ncbi:MAG TPA: histidine kinase N-terminal 7TM domain-containing protein [Natrialbaceae archaeon]|nr:histidine kinase N-terminal 7TM domain-containing protein [Natrialbaceae archaeon]